MLIQIHANGFKLHASLRDQVSEKIEAYLLGYHDQVRQVNAHLADVNGPKGGIDKSIRLVIDLHRKPTIVIEGKGEEWVSLLGSVVDRADRNVSRKIKKRRSRSDRTSMMWGDGGLT
jgi:putative sigma-54 modulation protein